jgi:hypothetical protein
MAMTHADSDLLKAVRTLLAQTKKGAIDWMESPSPSPDPANPLLYSGPRTLVLLTPKRDGGLRIAITADGEKSVTVSTEDTTPEVAEALERLYEAAAAAIRKPRTSIDSLLEDLGGN